MAKQILNDDVTNIAEEGLAGFALAYRRYYKKIRNYNAVIYRNHRRDKVALVIGGGSGHDPLFEGFVGAGLADACACGNICASPNPDLIRAAAKAADQGKGVLFVYGNYSGDNLNFDLAEKLCGQEGIETAHVRVRDDIASAPPDRWKDRRGVAGDVFTIKIAGAACDQGLTLEQVRKAAEEARNNTYSIGVATAPGTLPGNPRPTFELKEDEMEYGVGIHGEPGIERTKMKSCSEIVSRLYCELKTEMNLKEGDEICILVNGLGSTPLLSLNLAYLELYRLLKKDKVSIYDADVKQYCTTMEMAGFSISFLRLNDRIRGYYDAPCWSPFYSRKTEEAPMEVPEEEIQDEKTAGPGFFVKRSEKGILRELSAADTRNMLLYTAQKIIHKKDDLTQIDSAVGDGDHGTGMARGMWKVQEVLLSMQEEKNVYRLFEAVGNTMIMSMGGASGILFGSLFLSGTLDKQPKEKLLPKDLAQMGKESLAAVKARGGARVGDKTMVDALEPAVEAMRRNADNSLLEMLRAAEDAAEKGMENTKNYTAKFGRAKSLMGREIGYQDAGATSVYLIFQAMREFVEGLLDNDCVGERE